MAKRIAVVLSQSPRQDPARRDLEETLVAQLLMEDNLEVTIIPHLEHLDAEATGLLYLEGVSGDMILLGPQHPLDMHRQLAERNVHGRFGRTQQTRDLPPSQIPAGPGPRTIYGLDISQFASVAAARREILRIRREAETTLVGLSDLTVGRSLPIAPPLVAPPSGAPPEPPALPAQEAVDAADVAAPSVADADADSGGNQEQDRDQDLERQLDTLLDEFDRW